MDRKDDDEIWLCKRGRERERERERRTQTKEPERGKKENGERGSGKEDNQEAGKRKQLKVNWTASFAEK